MLFTTSYLDNRCRHDAQNRVTDATHVELELPLHKTRYGQVIDMGTTHWAGTNATTQPPLTTNYHRTTA